MDQQDLFYEIRQLIELSAEGEYWDFKQQWHSNNAELLHDIICMANNLVNRDAYIIVGVADSKSVQGVSVLGVPDEHRKSQQNLIDFLREKPFSGNYRPSVYVQTIKMGGVDIDVIVIKKSSNTPFYLMNPFHDGQKTVRSGHIYTRVGDTNTPIDRIADFDKVEHLWRRRFGIDLSANERLLQLLKRPGDWEGSMNDGEKKFHSIFPEYQATILDDDYVNESNQDNCILKNIADCYMDKGFSVSTLEITYHTTVLFSIRVIYIDGARHLIPFPNSDTIYLGYHSDLGNSLTYQYYDYSTVTGALMYCLSKDESNFWYGEPMRYVRREAFLEFRNETERQAFNAFVMKHLDEVLQLYMQALEEKGYQRTQSTMEYYYNGWSKANQIKAWYLFDLFHNITHGNISQYLPSLPQTPDR